MKIRALYTKQPCPIEVLDDQCLRGGSFVRPHCSFVFEIYMIRKGDLCILIGLTQCTPHTSLEATTLERYLKYHILEFERTVNLKFLACSIAASHHHMDFATTIWNAYGVVVSVLHCWITIRFQLHAYGIDHQWISLTYGKFGDPNDDATPHTNTFLVSCITIGYLCMIAGGLAGVVVCWGCIMKVCCNATIPNPIIL